MKVVLFFLIFSISGVTFAYDAHGPNTTVDYIYSRADEGMPFISFGPNAMPGCYADRGAYLPVGNAESSQRTFSMLLAAYMSGKPVSVYYDYATTDPNYNGWGKCHIVGIDLR